MCPLSLETFSVWRTDLRHSLYCKGSINSHCIQLWATNLTKLFLCIFFTVVYTVVASSEYCLQFRMFIGRHENTMGKAQTCTHNWRIFKIISRFNLLSGQFSAREILLFEPFLCSGILYMTQKQCICWFSLGKSLCCSVTLQDSSSQQNT